jgi:hypothetical protein
MTPTEKQCKGCGEIKPLNDFHKHPDCLYGRRAKCKVCRSQTYKQNSDEIRSRRRERYYKEDPKVRAAKWQEYKKRRKQEDPAYRLKEGVSTAVYIAIKKTTNGKSTKGGNTFEHLPYTPQELVQHIESQLQEGWSWDNYGSEWQIDHIYPQSKLPYDSLEHPNFQKCWALENLCPLGSEENRSKSDKIVS